MKNIIRKVVPFISILILLVAFTTIVHASGKAVVDDAKLLNDTEINLLSSEIESFKAQYNMDAVIVTSDDLGGKKPEEYAEDYYDYNGYGIGSEESGLLLLIDMDNRKIWISTKGDAITYFNDYRLDEIIDDISSYLKEGYYFDGCKVFIDDIKNYMNSGITEGQYTYSEEKRTRNIILIALGAATLVSGVTAIVVVNSYKNSKSVSSVNYLDNNSIVFTGRKDTFVSTFTSKRKIERNNGNNGGSSTHTSSSGDTHGGRGGSF